MQGIVVQAGPESVRDFLRRWPESARLYWYLDFYSSPFLEFVVPSDETNLLEELEIDVPSFSSSSQSVWRPGLFPPLAPKLFLDEQSYLIGLAGPEEQVPTIAEQLANCVRPSDEFVARIERLAEICIVYWDCWWEVYSLRCDWLAQIQKWYGGEVVESSHLTQQRSI